jgi:hypothetical protein
MVHGEGGKNNESRAGAKIIHEGPITLKGVVKQCTCPKVGMKC